MGFIQVSDWPVRLRGRGYFAVCWFGMLKTHRFSCVFAFPFDSDLFEQFLCGQDLFWERRRGKKNCFKKRLWMYGLSLSLHGGLDWETSHVIYTHQTSIHPEGLSGMQPETDCMPYEQSTKGVRRISVPSHTFPFTIFETALHRGESVDVCYKRAVGMKSAGTLSVVTHTTAAEINLHCPTRVNQSTRG